MNRTNQEALRTIEDVNTSALWPGKVVTEVKPVGDFWEAEPEHQDYLERYFSYRDSPFVVCNSLHVYIG